ncbi:hypothetical protein MATL_G00145160 [Megalops atlanticus]|uniref:Ig-like domain-containing protein n=1 Tax=Megalops atlanticus TaxID=7932 RepID=A0A9D3PYQ4_MEGAT|nr:hypothetical protein MATL_G00145160 [Megalops atlanticus]
MALQWVGLKILCLLFSLAVSPSMVLPVVVNGTMGASVTLPCEGSAYSHSSTPDVLWKTSDGVIVADFLQDIDNIYFKDRVKFNREGIKTRNFSITINPTFLSDEDNYKCVCRNCKKTILANVHLTVCAPPLKKSVSASIGDSVTLPCFSHVNRQTARDKLFVQWKRGDKLVLELSSGMFKTKLLDPLFLKLRVM